MKLKTRIRCGHQILLQLLVHKRNPYRVLFGKLEAKRLLRRHRRRWKDNIEMDLKRLKSEVRYKFPTPICRTIVIILGLRSRIVEVRFCVSDDVISLRPICELFCLIFSPATRDLPPSASETVLIPVGSLPQ